MTVLATCATLYGVAGSFSSLLQAAALVRAGSAREISIPFIAVLTGGHAIWLAYGVGITNLPLIATDSIGLCCALVTWITAVRLSGTVDQRQRMRSALGEWVDQAFTDHKVIAGANAQHHGGDRRDPFAVARHALGAETSARKMVTASGHARCRDPFTPGIAEAGGPRFALMVRRSSASPGGCRSAASEHRSGDLV